MNLDPQEEKLFMILQAIEQQGEQNKKTQANIEQLLKASQEQQSQLTKERVELNKDRENFAKAVGAVEAYLKIKAGEYERRSEQVELVYLEAVQDATLQAIDKKLQPMIESQVRAGIESGIEQAKDQSNKTTNAYMKAIATNTKLVNESTAKLQETLGMKTMSLIGGSLALFFALVIGFVVWWTPSLSEIADRRAELKGIQEQVKADFKTCGGQYCVKIKKDKCGYGDKGNYCQIATGWLD